jgi:hypothetical protein
MTLSQNTTWFGAYMVASLGFAMPLHALGNRPLAVLQNQKEDTLRKAFRKSFAMGAAIPGAELNKADKLSPQP